MATYRIIEDTEDGKGKEVVKITTTPSVQWAGDGDMIRAIQEKLRYGKSDPADPRVIEMLYRHLQSTYLWMEKDGAEL